MPACKLSSLAVDVLANAANTKSSVGAEELVKSVAYFSKKDCEYSSRIFGQSSRMLTAMAGSTRMVKRR